MSTVTSRRKMVPSQFSAPSWNPAAIRGLYDLHHHLLVEEREHKAVMKLRKTASDNKRYADSKGGS